MIGTQAPPYPVRTTFPFSKAHRECITLHPGSLTKHASAALLLLKETGLEVIFFSSNSSMLGQGDFKK